MLDWLHKEEALCPGRSFTIKDIYKGLKRDGTPRCIEIVWGHVAKFRESGVLTNTISIPIRYKLLIKTKEKV